MFFYSFCFANEEMHVGGEKGIGINFATTLELEVIEEGDVVTGVFLVGKEGETGYGSHQNMVDAGGGFDSCFSCHTMIFADARVLFAIARVLGLFATRGY